MSYRCEICGSQEIKEMYINKFGRKRRYQSSFGRKQYCSRDCMFIALYRRQLIMGVSAMLFPVAFGITMIILLSNWNSDDLIFAPIMVTCVGIFIGLLIFRQGIKGRRLKEARDFKHHF